MENNLRLNWDFSAIKNINIQQFCTEYSAQFNKVTKSAFMNKMSLNKRKLVKALKNSTHLGTVKLDGTLLGFCMLSVHEDKRLNGKLVLWINKLAISPKAQGNGLGVPKLLSELKQIIDVSQLGYVGCCTQNNTLINSLSKLGCKSYPLTHDYGTPQGVGIWTYLTLNVAQIKNALIEHFDELDELLISNHGIIKSGYRHPINVSTWALRPDVSEKLASRSFNQNNGDLLIMLTEL